MSDFKLTTPVALIIFNRPETTEKVFAAIRRAKPQRLLVVADGPRSSRAGEKAKCDAARSIIDRVDWDCEVFKNYSAVNLGCKKRVSSGLDWVFQTVEEAIILEDDCLPHPSFFRYCQELLEKYRYDQRIMLVSGDNYQFSRNETEFSYYFSRFNHIWGWASWRRAWEKYDVHMTSWPIARENNLLEDVLGKKTYVKYWSDIFDKVYNGAIDTWDYQWTFACWLNRGLSILPSINLISNIGFGSDSTHNSGVNQFSYMSVDEMIFPLRHPPLIIRDIEADDYSQKKLFSYSFIQKLAFIVPRPVKKQIKILLLKIRKLYLKRQR
jgi:hypothetical protein